MNPFDAIPPIAARLEGCDHADVQTAETDREDLSLESFTAGMFGARPKWITALFAVRGVLARLVGLDHPKAGERDTVPTEFEPGGKVAFFTSEAYAPGEYWLGGMEDSHLSAWVAVAHEPRPGGGRRFHVLTIVHHNNRLGPVYFALIKPFHVLIVRAMARRGARSVS
jgi:hypothetical protein